MSAKIKIGDEICIIEDGVWSCKNKALQRDLQQLCDEHFQNALVYTVDIDQQSALLAQKTARAEILEIVPAAGDDLPELAVY